MRTRNIVINAALVALSLGASALAAPLTPLPQSYTGLALNVAVTGHPYNVGNGGAFDAAVAHDTGFTDAFFTQFWCVDNENSISPGANTKFLANVTPLGNWAGGINADVRKGTLPAASWENGGALTPLQRYQAAAWLLSQTSFYLGLSLPGANDVAIQQAIWALTDVKGVSPNNSAWTNAFFTNAVNFISLGANVNYGKGEWAVVSGVVNSSGVVSATDRRQTFLVQLQQREIEHNPVPEPATYAMMGLGLLAIAGLRRRKS
ncbi:MAG TPA: PEP-CTERM sorting domain-containing protein [Paludibaculum sp.]|jgi:hypothetical protein